MTEEFNYKLCEERHEYLKVWCDDMDKRMQTVSNRFIAMLTGLALNLVGVIGVMIILLIQFSKD